MKTRFAGFGGPAELASSVSLPFPAHQVLIRPSDLVTEPEPGEMEEFVRKNAGQFLGARPQFLIQNDFALPYITSGIYRLSALPIRI